MEIYFLRHGQSVANSKRIIQGHLDSPLTDLGKEQASNLINLLPRKFDWIVSSDLARASETAAIASGLSLNNIILFKELREIGIGLLEGKSIAELNIHPEDQRLWLSLSEDRISDEYDSEPVPAFIERCNLIFNKIVDESKRQGYSKVLIVSHGGVMKAILEKTLHLTTSRFQNTELVRIEDHDSKWYLVDRLVP